METYYGMVKTPNDAIKLFEACRLGLAPRVQRRLSEKERQLIRSGSVFVWDEREAGMRRWTDGKSWSASRVSGSFLTYREMEGKRGGSSFNGGRRGAGKTPDSCRGSDEDQDDGENDGLGYRYKADGLMKQSFSITTSTGQHLHLISYYTRNQTDLRQPSTDPQFRSIVPPKGMYPESSMNDSGPPSTRTPMPPHYPPSSSPYMHQGWHQPQPYWPHSPVSTPPYQQASYPGPPPGYHHEVPHLPPLQHPPQYPHAPTYHHLPHPQQHHSQYQHSSPQPATHHHSPHPSSHPHHQPGYQPGPLPHPQNHLPPLQNPYPPAPQASHHTLPPPRSPPGPSRESSHAEYLQAQARKAVGTLDPSTASRDPYQLPNGSAQGPLPPLTTSSQHQHQQTNGNGPLQPWNQKVNGNGVLLVAQQPSPPSRNMSLSPSTSGDNRNNNTTAPLSAVSASKEPKLSAILDTPAPSASEPTSATSSTPTSISSPSPNVLMGGRSPGGSGTNRQVPNWRPF
ncbi:Gti1/Pac2 family-domain-containing protein [Cladorrhinum samala]|uniref:Gti1/Pac2 family-domain-containing protein n=1 Tax=Cladorrhinum samala TaxID=585594 RepID=A0AAV9HW36_9PEZI|nr:Gti1/Pac2 family-domain-containing protein [Cladorrhinum samala]